MAEIIGGSNSSGFAIGLFLDDRSDGSGGRIVKLELKAAGHVLHLKNPQ